MGNFLFVCLSIMAGKHQKIKVLYTIPNFDTAGSGKALLNLAQRLDPQKFEAEILCVHNKGEFFKTVVNSGIPVHLYPYFHPMKPYVSGIIKSLKCARFLKKISPDIIHSFHYGADYSEPLAAKLAGIPWIFTKKNMNWGGSSKNGWKLRGRLAKGIIVQNSKMLETFYKNHPNVECIGRGVVIEQFKNWPFEHKEERIIICVANLVPVKGVEILLHAFKKYEASNPSWKLWILGDCDNDYGKQLIQWTESNHLSTKIRFLGKQLNVQDYLKQAEIFVLPSLEGNKYRGEGSPVALLEAMASGKVTIGSAISGITDQLNNYPELLFEAGNADQLAEKLNFYMNRPILENEQLGNALSEFAKTHFSIEKEVEKHEQFYIRTLKG